MLLGALGHTLAFGWAKAGHDAILQKAMQALPSSPLKMLLETHQSQIDAVSQKQDRHFPGPAHYINLEQIWEKKAPARLSPEHRQFHHVRDYFSESVRQEVADSFQKRPLSVGEVEYDVHSPNVFESVVSQYQVLLSQLKNPATPTTERVQTLGALSHYVGDLFQPLHTSLYYTWKLPKRKIKSHAFMENRVFDAQDYDAWTNRPFAKPLEKLSFQEIQRRLAQGIQEGYLQIFPLLQQDIEARQRYTVQQDGKSTLDSERYVDALKQAWKPMVDTRMEQASYLLASLLNSAYQEASCLQV